MFVSERAGLLASCDKSPEPKVNYTTYLGKSSGSLSAPS